MKVEELRPRYADRVSEPDDDSDADHRRKTTRPSPRPEVLLEEEEDAPDTVVHTIPRRTSGPHRTELITDLDETVEDETLNVSVAERVNLFLENARQSANSPQPSRPEDITLKGLDDTINAYMDVDEQDEAVNCVSKAKTMFETIAKTQTETKTSQRDIRREQDIITRPSVFEAPRPETPEQPSKPIGKIDIEMFTPKPNDVVTREAIVIERATVDTKLTRREDVEISQSDTEECEIICEEPVKPIGKIDINKFTPKTNDNTRKETVRVGKINTEKFENKTVKNTDTFPRRKAPSPERKPQQNSVDQTKKESSEVTIEIQTKKQSTKKVSREETKRSSPARSSPSRASPERSSPSRASPERKSSTRASPSRASPERKPTTINTTETIEVKKSVVNRYPFAKPAEEPKKEFVRPSKSNAVSARYPVGNQERRSSPPRKDTPTPLGTSPVKVTYLTYLTYLTA